MRDVCSIGLLESATLLTAETWRPSEKHADFCLSALRKACCANAYQHVNQNFTEIPDAMKPQTAVCNLS